MKARPKNPLKIGNLDDRSRFLATLLLNREASTMFSLIKIGIDIAFIILVFYAGMRVQLSYPNLLADIKGFFADLGNVWTWLKGLAGKL